LRESWQTGFSAPMACRQRREPIEPKRKIEDFNGLREAENGASDESRMQTPSPVVTPL
jgi:hypothetical protein